jgi:potassium/hydrogen antiporter
MTGDGMTVSLLFLIAGIILLLGLVGSFSFEKTRIPDVLILMIIGMILGPVSGLIKFANLAYFAEYFGTFALMVILFEGGMDMDLETLIKEFGAASTLVMVSFVLSATAIGAFFALSYRWDIMQSLLFGTILGCTSAAVIIPTLSRMSLRNDAKMLLTIESALSDVLAVVCTISLLEFIKLEKVGIEAPFRAVASAFSIAILAGVASGMFWLKVRSLLGEQKYSYMLVLAYILVVFAVTDFLGGSGPIAVLVTGIILGNGKHFSRILKTGDRPLTDETIKFFHGEITFFIRTFFFVYMGMMINFSSFNAIFLMVSLSLLLIILGVRYLSTEIICGLFKNKREYKLIVFSMVPRGLASAVLATLPMAANLTGSQDFINYTFAVIVLTNIVMSTGVFMFQKRLVPGNE